MMASTIGWFTATKAFAQSFSLDVSWNDALLKAQYCLGRVRRDIGEIVSAIACGSGRGDEGLVYA